MNETSHAATCSRCGAALAPGALKGLCPRCLMELNLVAPTEFPGEAGPHGTTVTKPPPTLEELARHFPQFQILECLGRGGMGVVYKARQPKLNRIVALKVLAPEKAPDPKFAERFAREAQALARLNHPNIVTVYDFGEADGLYYLTMEFVDGVSLRRLLQTRKIEPEEALAIVPKICEALQFAHDEGVVHRDIKPENILLDKKGRVKIADFGIAKILAGEGGAGSPLPAEGAQAEGGPQGTARPTGGFTQDQVLGTPNYMAPEQVEHPQKVDHRADIYSLGVVFYEMLTGELPLGKFQPPSKKVHVDVRLDEVVLHTLEKEPELRYQQASQVKTAVETIAATTAPGPPVARESADLENARDQVKVPAIGLIVISGLALCVLAVAVPIWIVGMLLSVTGKARLPWVFVIPMLLFMTGCNILSLIGAWRMRQLRSYTLAVVGSILFILSPWVGIQAGTICSVSIPAWSSMSGVLLGLIFGVWSLIVLSRHQVQEAFVKARSLPPGTAPLGGTASGAASAAHGRRAALACVAIAMTVVVLVAGVPPVFSVPVVVLSLLSIVVLTIGTVARAAEPVPGARMTADAWITVAIALALGGGLLTTALVLKNKDRAASQTATAGPSAAHEPAWRVRVSFGPVIERELSGSESLSNCFLDLDSGRILSAPRELVESLRTQGKLNGGDPNLELLREWMRSSGADIVKRTGGETNRWSLVQLDGVCEMLPEEAGKKFHAEDFDTVSVEPVIRALKSAEEEAQPRGGLTAENRGSRLSFRGDGLFAFKTREGGMGVLQVLGEDPNLPSVEVRYKLVQHHSGPGTYGSNPTESAVDLGGGVRMEFVLIPAGSFMMGSPRPDEAPMHRGTISKPFYLGKYEITQEQWESLMPTNRSYCKGPKLPVANVSWEDAQEFLKKLQERTGRTFALPTEAQWEYACRAGTSSEYSFGDSETDLEACAWFAANSQDTTHPVGEKKPNRWGLYDMHGNVWERCADGFEPYRPGPATDPKSWSSDGLYVVRGGGWRSHANGLRCSNRNNDLRGAGHVGLRCVMLTDGVAQAQAQTGEQYIQQQLNLAKAGNYWAKYNLWKAYSRGEHGVAKNPAEAAKLLPALVKGVYLAKFEPANGFHPATPQEILYKFVEHSQLQSWKHSVGGAGFFRTKKQGDKLIGSFLTSSPDRFKAALQKNPDLKLISMEPVTPEMFLAHEAAEQESL